MKLAQKILQKFENEKFIDITIDELKTIHGLGPVKSCEILACFELGRRMLKGKNFNFTFSKDVWERMEDIRGSKKEHFVVFIWTVETKKYKRNYFSWNS